MGGAEEGTRTTMEVDSSVAKEATKKYLGCTRHY
jgi:hypothetical protein